MAETLGTFKAFLRDRNSEDASARAERDYARIANDASAHLRRRRQWTFDKRLGAAVFQPPYATGQLASFGFPSADGSFRTIVGTGTAWNTSPQHLTGGLLQLPGGTLGVIDTIDSDLTLTLRAPGYVGIVPTLPTPYTITCARFKLPTDFRCFWKPQLNTGWWYSSPLPIEEVLRLLTMYPSNFQPCYHAIEDAQPVGEAVAQGAPPVKWLWVYPSPAPQQSLPFPYQIWIPEATADGDQFGLPDVPLATAIFRQYGLALLLQQQGKQSQYQDQLIIADKMADEGLASFIEVPAAGERRMWRAGDQGVTYPYQGLLAPGVLPLG